MLLCNQHHTLTNLIDEISSKVGGVCRLSHCHLNAIDTLMHALSVRDNNPVVFSVVFGFVENVGECREDLLNAINNVNRGKLS